MNTDALTAADLNYYSPPPQISQSFGPPRLYVQVQDFPYLPEAGILPPVVADSALVPVATGAIRNVGLGGVGSSLAPQEDAAGWLPLLALAGLAYWVLGKKGR